MLFLILLRPSQLRRIYTVETPKKREDLIFFKVRKIRTLFYFLSHKQRHSMRLAENLFFFFPPKKVPITKKCTVPNSQGVRISHHLVYYR